jgi:hypothetical protein
MTPSDGKFAREGEKAGRRPLLDDSGEVVFVLVTSPMAIGCADAPVRAPAAGAGAAIQEEVFNGAPEVGSEGRIFSFGMT